MNKLKCKDYGGKKRHTREPCNNPAGMRTDHPGTGKCYLHGGSSTGRPITTGKQSVKHKAALQAKIDHYMEDPNPLDLTREIAMLRALCDDYYLRKQDTEDELTLHTLQTIYAFITDISKTTERFSRIINQTALTVAEVNFLQARLADLIVKYLPDEDRRDAFWDEFRQAVNIHRPSRRSIEDSSGESQSDDLAVPF